MDDDNESDDDSIRSHSINTYSINTYSIHINILPVLCFASSARESGLSAVDWS